HLRQLPRQQHRHHAQVVDDRQQQAAQAFAVAPGLAPRMQRPDLVGRVLSVEQAGNRGQGGNRIGGRGRAQARQVEQQRSRQGRFVGAQAGQGGQGVGNHRPWSAGVPRGALRVPGGIQAFAQRRRQGGRGRILQQGVQTVDDRARQGRSGAGSDGTYTSGERGAATSRLQR